MSSQPKFAAIETVSLVTTAEATLVAAVAGKKIRVLSMVLDATGATSFTMLSDTGGTALTGTIATVTTVATVWPFSPYGWFETVSGELLSLLNTGVTSFFSGVLVYAEI